MWDALIKDWKYSKKSLEKRVRAWKFCQKVALNGKWIGTIEKRSWKCHKNVKKWTLLERSRNRDKRSINWENKSGKRKWNTEA